MTTRKNNRVALQNMHSLLKTTLVLVLAGLVLLAWTAPLPAG
jgi:hypothetical protein